MSRGVSPVIPFGVITMRAKKRKHGNWVKVLVFNS